MTSGERSDLVEESANRILSDDRAAEAYATYVDAQLRSGRRTMSAWLGRLAHVFMVAFMVFSPAESFFGPFPLLPEQTFPWTER